MCVLKIVHRAWRVSWSPVRPIRVLDEFKKINKKNNTIIGRGVEGERQKEKKKKQEEEEKRGKERKRREIKKRIR